MRPPVDLDEVEWLGEEISYPELDEYRLEFCAAEDVGLALNLDQGLWMPTLDLSMPGFGSRCIAWNPEGDGEIYVPALRWEELDLFCRGVGSWDPDLPHPGIPVLLLHPFAPLCLGDDARKVLATLRAAWRSLGLFSDREIARFLKRFDRRKDGYFWKEDGRQVWTLWQQVGRTPRGVELSCRFPGKVSEPDIFRAFEAAMNLNRAWCELINELSALRSLEGDWDGQGAEAPAPALVDGAIHLARQLQAQGSSPAHRVTAGVNGTVFLSWHLPELYREIEVVSPTEAEVRQVPKGSMQAEVSRLHW